MAVTRDCWLGIIARLVGVTIAGAAAVAAAQPVSLAGSPGTPMADQAAAADDPPTTVVVTRFVRRGCEQVFERLWQQMVPVRARMPGHLGTDFIRPAGPFDGAYHMIYRFDRASHYQAWLHSPEREVWLKRVDAVTEGQPSYQFVNGLEAWVTPPGRAGGPLPAKYKTTVVTWLAIFPLVLGIGAAVNPLAAGLSVVTRTALVTAIVVPALGYLVMPPMTWLFQDWLYPPAPACPAG